jgi:hypothetical protein
MKQPGVSIGPCLVNGPATVNLGRMIYSAHQNVVPLVWARSACLRMQVVRAFVFIGLGPHWPVFCRSSIFHVALCTGTESGGGKSALGRIIEDLSIHVPEREIVSMEQSWR